MSDDDFESFVAQRAKVLGFRPQKELQINQLLPYADQLDEESTRLFRQIKTNLAKAVMLREMKPACGVWTARLMKYIKIYGLKFSKEDHISLIKLVYELVIIPDLEPSKVHKFATLFIMLTKWRYLISPEELTLPWRPLYDMGIKLFDKSRTHIGMFHYLSPTSPYESEDTIDMNVIRKFLSGSGLADALELFGFDYGSPDNISLESSYISLVKFAKPYFPLSATKEILDECLPQIVPWTSENYLIGCHQLAVCIPVTLPPEHAAHGYELWFDEFMTLWDTCPNAPCGIKDLMLLFSSLAKRSPGAVDWTPHVPKMFTRFLHAMNLPVSYKDLQYSRSHVLETKYIASWIVWTIKPDGLVLKHLRSFLAGMESYLQSANAGRWAFRLRDLLRKLSKEFLNRVRRERDKKFKNTWENQSPESFKLRDEDITEFVQIVFDLTQIAIHSRNGSMDVSSALQNLATLRPQIVIPPLIERLNTSLESLTEPHRVTAAIAAVAAVARPMVQGALSDYPAGPTHVAPLLHAVLPGLDPNDMKKTMVSLHFILIFSWMVPFIDCSSAHEYYSDLTEEEILTCESTAQFEDFVLLFLERLFGLVESSVLENVRHETKETDSVRSKSESVLEISLSSAATAVLMQCSPKIFSEALRKFKKFAMTNTFETSVAGRIIGALLRVFARVNSELTLAAFIPDLTSELNELLSTDEVFEDENPPRELVYYLLLLTYAVDGDGKELMKYIPQLTPVLDRALKLHSRDAAIRASNLLGHIMMSLGFVELRDYRSSPKDYSKAPQDWLPIREWGKGCRISDAKFEWHTPSKEEVECAQMLFDKYGKPEMERLRLWVTGERPICKKRRLRSFFIVNAITICCTLLPPPEEPPVQFNDSLVPATTFPFACGVKYHLKLDGKNVRSELIKLLHQVQDKMVTEKSDDTRGFDALLQVWDRVSCVHPNRAGASFEARLRSNAALERALDGKGGPPGSGKTRTLLADAARLQEETRLDLQNDAGITASGLTILDSFYQLSIYSYTTIRILAQIRLFWMVTYHAYSYRALIPQLAKLLTEGVGSDEEWHDRHKGALYVMLGPRVAPLVAKQDWEAAKMLWPAILKAPLTEKPSIVRIEQLFSDTLHRMFPAVNTKLTITPSCVDAAKQCLDKEVLDDQKFAQYLADSEELEKANNRKTEKVYIDLIEELVTIAETPNIQWRRLELILQMLTYCPSLQTNYPARAVRFIMNSLIHDNIAVRKTAIKLTHFVLKQRKHKVKKVKVNPYEVAGVPKPEKPVRGYREDNKWAMWDSSRIPQNDAEWERPWLRNSFTGFYAWPDQVEVAAPSCDQVPLDRSPESMEEGERYIFEFFSNEANVDKLVGYLTEEDKKGKDKFNPQQFAMFRILFRCFGPRIGERILAHALKHASEAQESSQRFAAVVAAAAVRGPRYWPRAQAYEFYDKAVQIIRTGLTSVTPESMEDWGTCIASAVEDLCPNRGGTVLNALLEICAPKPSQTDDVETDQHASFVICARLYALQGALASMTWRTAPLAGELLRKLEAARFLQHPYQNVRESIGSILMTILDTELVFQGGAWTGGAARLADMLERLRPTLANLYTESGELAISTYLIKSYGCMSSVPGVTRESPAATPEPELDRTDTLVAVEVARLSPDGRDNDESTGQGNAEQMEPVEEASIHRGGASTQKSLADRLDTALRLSGDYTPPGPKDHARAANLLTTVLRGCMGLIVRGLRGASPTYYELMRIACALSARGPPQPHDELGRAADGFLASLAIADHSEQTFDEAITNIEQVATSKSWWARMACVEFALPLIFYGLPMLSSKPERAAKCENFALNLMRDSRLEVKQQAAKLLTGLMHYQALPNEDQTINKLMKSCRSKEIVERHCGVLGLCAYLSSRPYSLAPRIGEVLAELSRHTNAPDPIPKSISTALADFRRTHQDDWPKHREALTEEELDILADLAAPPSYYA